MARGRLITLEGGEGAGKTTQCAGLLQRLRAHGRRAIATREPGGTPEAEAVRALLVENAPAPRTWDATSEALLHFAARRSHLKRVIEPALARGDWVVCDRFVDSTMAYQGYAMGLGRAAVETLHHLVLDGLSPDLTLILDLPVADGLARARSRGEDNRYEMRDTAFHEAVRRAFLDIARRDPDRCTVINARDGVDAVAAAIERAVLDAFNDGR